MPNEDENISERMLLSHLNFLLDKSYMQTYEIHRKKFDMQT